MEKSELMNLSAELLSNSKTAVLSTVSKDGPRMRWMSPVFLNSDYNHIYAVTSSELGKTTDISENENVQWMLQSKSLDKIITFNGIIRMVEDLSLRNEVIQTIGAQLQTFWTINKDPSTLTVLETEIESAVVFYPVKGQKHLITYK